MKPYWDRDSARPWSRCPLSAWRGRQLGRHYKVTKYGVSRASILGIAVILMLVLGHLGSDPRKLVAFAMKLRLQPHARTLACRAVDVQYCPYPIDPNREETEGAQHEQTSEH